MSTNKSYLPEKGTEEAQKLIDLYESASDEEINRLAEAYGYKNRHNFVDAMRKCLATTRQLVKPDVNLEDQKPEVIQQPAPEVKIIPLKQEARRGQGEEEHLQLISDTHCGVITPSYNVEVFRQRLTKLSTRITAVCQLHRKMRPIKKLITPLLGDIVHGEQYGRQGMVEEFEMGAEQQIYEVLVPEFANFYINLLQIYERIYIPGVPGNHGNIEPRSQRKSQRSNWDTIFYRALKQALSKYSRLQIDIPPVGQWYMVIEVNGWKFLLVHGDQIISYQGVPFYGMEKRSLRWKQSIGINEPFDYILSAHVHNPNFLWNAGVPMYVNGCFITDSNFPLVRMGLKDIPQQWSLFVNKKFGVTAQYRIQLG